MYRVKLSLHQFKLRLLGNTLHVRLLVQKDGIKLILPKKYRLLDGLAIINDEFEFYMSQSKNSFKLLVLLESQSSKSLKIAGSNDIKLKTQMIGKESQMTMKLQNCPDYNANISLSIFFEEENNIQFSKPIESSAEVDRRIYLNEIKEIRGKLSVAEQAIKKSASEFDYNIEAKDRELKKMQDQLTKTKREKDEEIKTLRKELKQKDIAVDQYSRELMQAKKKLADVIDILNQNGDGSVLERIQNLLNE